MGLMDTDKTLPANRLVFDVRRDLAMVERFRTDLEGLMQEYGLSDAEKRALREVADVYLTSGRSTISHEGARRQPAG